MQWPGFWFYIQIADSRNASEDLVLESYLHLEFELNAAVEAWTKHTLANGHNLLAYRNHSL